MTNRYRIERGADNIDWVSIQPLMEDVNQAVVHLMEIDSSRLDDVSRRELDLKLLGLRAIYEFMGALVTEKTLELTRKERENGH